MIYGSRPGEGNTTVLPQLHPCGDCIKNFGLGGINAREAQREKQEALHPTPKKGKGKKSKLRGGHSKWIWRHIRGDRWCGVQKVREDRLESTRVPPFSRDELDVIAEMESKLGLELPLTVEQTYFTPHPVALTVGGPVPFPIDPISRAALEQFAFMDEAGRRGMQMKMEHTNRCLELPQGTNVPVDTCIAPGAPVSYNSPPLIIYGPQPALVPASVATYTPQPVNAAPLNQPVILPDGTVELPDEWDSCREAFVTSSRLPVIEVNTPSSRSSESDDSNGATHEFTPQDKVVEAETPSDAMPKVFDMLDQERKRLSLFSLKDFEHQLSPTMVPTKTERSASTSAADSGW